MMQTSNHRPVGNAVLWFGAPLLLVLAACGGPGVTDSPPRLAAVTSEFATSDAPTTVAVTDAPTTSASLTTAARTTAEPTTVPVTSTATPTTLPALPAGDASALVLATGPVPALAAGTPGKVAVIAVGSFEEHVNSPLVPVMVRNQTSQTVAVDQVTGIARTADGSLLATGSDQGFQPRVVAPGEIAFGFVYFGDLLGVARPAGVTVEVSVVAGPPSAYFMAVTPTEVKENAKGSVSGVFMNSHATTMSGPISIDGICVDEAGQLVTEMKSFADQDEVPAGGTGTFTLSGRGALCPGAVLIAGSGYES